MPAHVRPRRVESRIPRTREPPITAASWDVERAPREVEAENDEQAAGDERRARHPRARAGTPALDELDEEHEPREDAQAHAEGEAAGPGGRRHEQTVPDEEGDEERPVHEERRIRRTLQEARQHR